MEKFIERGLEKIREEKIVPTARWKFETKNFLWWLALGVSVLAGGISISILVFLVTQLDWQIYAHLGDSFWETFLIMFPHVWFLLMAFFVFFSYRNLRNTKKGYRLEWFFVWGAIVGGSVLLGLVFYFSGASEKLNQVFASSVPGYEKVIHTKEDQWSQPEKGLLSGEIISKQTEEGTEVLNLKTFQDEDWQVSIDSQTVVRGKVDLQEGEEIKVIGKQKEQKNEFQAQEVRPWQGNGQGGNQARKGSR